ASAYASPTVSLDDPVYEDLQRVYALDALPPYSGGFRPLTERRARRLLTMGHLRVPQRFAAPRDGLWSAPLRRARASLASIRDRKRSYSTPIRPRDIAGSLSLSCERREGAPCGEGLGMIADLDSAAGYGDW